jgi:ribokinase
MPGILVVGSVNADIILHLDRLPHAGETIAASNDSGKMVPGGKGANQAVAAANLGATTAFAGRFGRDAHAATLRAVMQSHNVDISLSEDAAPGTPSGQAFILLQHGGENSIIIVGGANATWAPELPAALIAGVEQASIILLQREVPDHVNIAVARVAKAKGIAVVLDVGGRAEPFPDELLPLISIISPNETELARCLGLQSIGDSEAEVRQ